MPMQKVALRQYPEILRVIRAADPSYKKRDAYVDVRDKVTLSDTAWDGGTRSTYTAVNLATLQSAGAPQYDPPQFGGPKSAPVVTIPQGVAIVETGYFLGKTATAHVHVHPDNVAKLLSEPLGTLKTDTGETVEVRALPDGTLAV